MILKWPDRWSVFKASHSMHSNWVGEETAGLVKPLKHKEWQHSPKWGLVPTKTKDQTFQRRNLKWNQTQRVFPLRQKPRKIPLPMRNYPRKSSKSSRITLSMFVFLMVFAEILYSMADWFGSWTQHLHFQLILTPSQLVPKLFTTDSADIDSVH